MNKAPIIISSILGVALISLAIIYRNQLKKSAKSLLSKFVSGLRNTALSEWDFWKQGQLKEKSPEVMERLRRYWQEGAGIKNWTDEQMKSEAWSAAFISYIMKKSGAGDQWRYSPSHSTYIVETIKNRKLNNDNPFKGYKPEEVKLKIGDLVGYPRQAGVGYDTTGNYKSHVDVVVGVKDGYAETIGGNISNSVSMTKVPITPDGKIDKKSGVGSRYFVVIKNNK